MRGDEPSFPNRVCGAFDCERKKNVGAAKCIVIEEVQGMRLELGEIERPAANRNGKTNSRCSSVSPGSGRKPEPVESSNGPEIVR